jgi:hypothetical protein
MHKKNASVLVGQRVVKKTIANARAIVKKPCVILNEGWFLCPKIWQ